MTSRSCSAIFSSTRPRGFAKLKAVRFYKDQRGRHALNKADVDTRFKKKNVLAGNACIPELRMGVGDKDH